MLSSGVNHPPTLLNLAADACATALKRGDRRVVAGLKDLHSDLAEVIAVSYILPLSTHASSRKFFQGSRVQSAGFRALAEANALSPSHLTLSMCATPPTLSRSGLEHLHLASHSLQHLEIQDSPWLDTLEPWFKALPRLKTLSLSGCVALPPEALAALAATDDDDSTRGNRSKLVTLDLSRCAMTDAAGPHLARVSSSLQHLDLSHCPVGNLLLDFITYKVRLKRWRQQQQQRRQQQSHRGESAGAQQRHPAALAAMEMSGMRVGLVTEEGRVTPNIVGVSISVSDESGGGEDDDDDECNIHDLRLRRTNVSDSGVSNLHALKRITLLDLSLCGGVQCASLQPLARMHRLSAMHPEDKRILTCSNAVAAAWRPVPTPSASPHSFSSRFPSPSCSVPPSSSSSPSSSCGCAGSGLRGMCTGCTTPSDGNNNGAGGGLAEEGWTAFLCAVREEEERGERERQDAAAAAEREAAQMFYQRSGVVLGGVGSGEGIDRADPIAEIPMFPIGPPPTYTHPPFVPSSGGSPDAKVRRTSYLIG